MLTYTSPIAFLSIIPYQLLCVPYRPRFFSVASDSHLRSCLIFVLCAEAAKLYCFYVLLKMYSNLYKSSSFFLIAKAASFNKTSFFYYFIYNNDNKQQALLDARSGRSSIDQFTIDSCLKFIVRSMFFINFVKSKKH